MAIERFYPSLIVFPHFYLLFFFFTNELLDLLTEMQTELSDNPDTHIELFQIKSNLPLI